MAFPDPTKPPLNHAQAPPDITADVVMDSKRLFRDLWHDAEMMDVLVYLRGGVGLQLPDEWHNRLPSEGRRGTHKRR